MRLPLDHGRPQDKGERAALVRRLGGESHLLGFGIPAGRAGRTLRLQPRLRASKFALGVGPGPKRGLRSAGGAAFVLLSLLLVGTPVSGNCRLLAQGLRETPGVETAPTQTPGSKVLALLCTSLGQEPGEIPHIRLTWHLERGEHLPADIPKLYVERDAGLPLTHVLQFEGPLTGDVMKQCALTTAGVFHRIEVRGRRVTVRPRDSTIKLDLRRLENKLLVFDLTQVARKLARARDEHRWADVVDLLTDGQKRGIDFQPWLDGASVADLERTARINFKRSAALEEFAHREYAAALPLLYEALDLAPRDFEVGLALAKAHYRLDAYDEAERHFLSLYRLNPRHGEVLLYLGLIDLWRNQVDSAIGYLDRAVAARSPNASFYLGFALYQRGHLWRAQEAFEGFLASSPGSQLATRARQLLDHMARLHELGAAPSGTRTVATVAERDPELEVPRSPPPALGTPVKPTPRQVLSKPRAETGAASIYERPIRLPGFRRPTVSLEDCRGQVVVLHLWASWCPPCLEEMPALLKFYNSQYRELRSGGLKLLTVSMDYTSEDLGRYVERKLSAQGDDFPIYWDPEWATALALGLDGALPKTIVIDRSGRVRLVHRGPYRWQSESALQGLRTLVRSSSR